MPVDNTSSFKNYFVLVCDLHWKAYVPGDVLALTNVELFDKDGFPSYFIPDTGNGDPGYLPEQCLEPCPPEIIEPEHITEGEIIITRVGTIKGTSEDAPTPELKPQWVEIPLYPGYLDQQLQVYLSEWTTAPLTIEIINRASKLAIVKEDAMKYIGGHHLLMKLTDFPPGFYTININFINDWKHEIMFIKKLPFKMDMDIIPIKQLYPKTPIVFANELDITIKNKALSLVLEWGEEFGKPISSRILKQYSNLSHKEIEALEQLANKAKFEFFELYTQAINHKTITVEDVYSRIKLSYPWINDENLSMLASQGNYYAMRG